ncbi:MAG TPA: circadian clock KaiB family protein [Vicinamibacteria bacterium]|jgi:CheY-like chemotaxis protein
MTAWPATTRILLVESDEDHRKLLGQALRNQSYAVDEAASAAEARTHLAGARYALMIAHYSLPDSTATELLRSTRGEGLLADTPAIVFTGQPDIEKSGDFELMRKPLAVSDLLRQVQAIVGAPVGPEASAPAVAEAARVQLVLYVTKPWPSSQRAIRNLETALAGLAAGEVGLEVCDLAREPERADHDRVIFSPTLVRVRPEPRMWVVGDLTDRAVLADLLSTCGVDLPLV